MKVVHGNKGQQGQPDPNMQVKVALKDTSDVTCEKCDHKLFTQLMMFKKLSAVMSPTGEESLIPIQVFACNDCGHVNKQFIPPTGNEG